MKELVRDLLDVLAPVTCVVCGAPADARDLTWFCADCAARVPARAWPLGAAVEGVRSGWYLLPYAGLGGVLVRRAKYGRRERLLAELALLAARGAVGTIPPVDRVVAVPSAAGRRLARGFSAPDVLAAAVARGLGVPVDRPLGRRAVPRQAGQRREARVANVAGSVRVRHPLPDQAAVLLVDDVVTTGATAAECARALLEAGAGAVHLYAFASVLT